MKKTIFALVACVMLAAGGVSCGKKGTSLEVTDVVEQSKTVFEQNDGRYVKVDTLDSLVVYYPQFSTVDLVCGKMPAKEDTNVVFCAAAAFTGTFMDTFRHNNIAGDHVSGGKRYAGYECRANTGCFVYYGKGRWDFVEGDGSKAFDKAAAGGGMGYEQILMIKDGKVLQTYRTIPNNTKDVNEFRALCELGGTLCIIDSRGYVNFEKFVRSLANAGVKDAIYMDMGDGWNYSWWRHSDGTAVEIHSTPSAYTTNWITFYK